MSCRIPLWQLVGWRESRITERFGAMVTRLATTGFGNSDEYEHYHRRCLSNLTRCVTWSVVCVCALTMALLAISDIRAACYVQHWENAATLGCSTGMYVTQGPCHLGDCVPPGQSNDYCGDRTTANNIRSGVSLENAPGSEGFVVDSDHCYTQCDCSAQLTGPPTRTCTGWFCFQTDICTFTPRSWQAQHADEK